MSTQNSKGDQLNLKLNILKRGILEEREKNSQLQTENNKQKEELHEKKEYIAKLQEEINILRDNTGKKQIKKFFTTFFEGEEEEDQHNKKQEEEITTLKNELAIVKEQIASMQKEKTFLNTKLNEQIKRDEELKTTLKNEIEQVKQYYEEKEQYNADDSTRIESMRVVISKLERENLEYIKTIDIFDQKIKKKVIEMEILMKGQNQLLEEIDCLKNEVHEYKKENINLRNEIEALTPVTKKTIFEGTRIRCLTPRKTSKIKLSFGEIEDNVIIYEGKQSGRVVDLRYIKLLKLFNDNRIDFTIKTMDYEEHYRIEFRLKFIPYILQYFNEFTTKEEQLNGKKLKEESFNNIFTKYSIGDTFY